MNEKVKAAALSYFRAAAASVAAIYISGITDPKDSSIGLGSK